VVEEYKHTDLTPVSVKSTYSIAWRRTAVVGTVVVTVVVFVGSGHAVFAVAMGGERTWLSIVCKCN
jgi:hypothetical protein